MMIEYNQKKYSHDFRKAKSIPKAQNLGPTIREQRVEFTKLTQVQVYNELEFRLSFFRSSHIKPKYQVNRNQLVLQH